MLSAHKHLNYSDQFAQSSSEPQPVCMIKSKTVECNFITVKWHKFNCINLFANCAAHPQIQRCARQLILSVKVFKIWGKQIYCCKTEWMRKMRELDYGANNHCASAQCVERQSAWLYTQKNTTSSECMEKLALQWDIKPSSGFTKL